MPKDSDLDDLVLHALRYLSQDEPPDAEHPEMASALADPEVFTALLARLSEMEPDVTAPSARALGAQWEDWLDGHEVSVAAVADTLADFDALKDRLRSSQNPMRATGQRHSDNCVARPQAGSVVLDLRKWQGKKVKLARKKKSGNTYVRVFAWEKLADLVARLDAAGLALINTGSYTGQTLAGPLSMGTHGSGAELGSMSDSVVSVDILDGSGVVRRVRSAASPFDDDETVKLPGKLGEYEVVMSTAPLSAAVVNLGTYGVVVSYVLQVIETYWLEQTVRVQDLATALAWIGQGKNRRSARHIELVVSPEEVDGKQVATIERKLVAVGSKPVQPIKALPAAIKLLQGHPGRTKVAAGFVDRSAALRKHVYQGALAAQAENDGAVGPWSNILVRDTGIAAHGFEVHFPAHYTVPGIQAALKGIQDAFDLDRARATAPMGVRFVSSGDQMLGMNNRHLVVANRKVEVKTWCTIEIPRLLGTRKADAIPKRVLAALAAAGIPARPHWGQYFPMESLDAAGLYPQLADWRAGREQHGASSRFMTPTVAKATGSLTPRPVAGPRGPVLQGVLAKRVLFLHGIGDHHTDTRWMAKWEQTLAQAAATAGLPAPSVEFLRIDDLFSDAPLSAVQAADALAGLLGSLLRYRMSRQASRGWLDDTKHWLEWKPGMVAEWLENEDIRAALRGRLTGLIECLKPDVVAAHSLGGLVAYDTLSQAGFPTKHRFDLVTFGSQIGHKGLRAEWGGRIQKPEAVKTWMHVYNPADKVFTARVPVADVHNLTIDTGSAPDPHLATLYIGHPSVVAEVWPTVLGEQEPSRPLVAMVQQAAHRRKKALLVGIDEYADPTLNLGGCVNDVYAISALLQTRFGYGADDVRVLTNHRATADSLRSRMEWLLEDAGAEDHRVFYYSGHGAQIPGYNAMEVIDQVDECLVPHDFDWDRPETAIVDDEFLEMYAQLCYDVRFTAVFDCCHSGGMARATAARVRGISPPDDIRHRLLQYDQGWKSRGDAVRRDKALRAVRTKEFTNAFLGSAQSIRPARTRFKKERAARGHEGPFLPVLIYGCGEGELAFEHRVGPVVHGAFTHSLAQQLAVDDGASFRDVVKRVKQTVNALGYTQTPSIEGPRIVVDAPFGF